MGFQIVSDVPRTIWAPLAQSTVAFTEATPRLYVGEIVTCKTSGINRLGYAYAWNDSLHRAVTRSVLRTATASTGVNNVPFGVVIGTNRRTPVFSTTYNAEYVDYVNPVSAGTDDFALVGGGWSQGDRRAMVKIALITAETVLRAPLYSSTNAPGTAPTVYTVTASTSGRTMTSAATIGSHPFQSTVYFRSGSQAGVYRDVSTTTTTINQWREHLRGSTAANGLLNDTFTKVSCPSFGKGRATIPTRALFFTANAANTTNWFGIDVIKLDLSVAGQEYVEFRFDPSLFGIANYATT